MDGDMVDAGARRTAIVTELWSGRRHRAGEVTEDIGFAAPISPRGFAVDIVPLRPARREAADLIAANSNIPGLRDQLDLSQNWILANGGEKGSIAIEPGCSCQRGGKIKPKSIDVKDLDPVPQRIHHHLQHARM